MPDLFSEIEFRVRAFMRASVEAASSDGGGDKSAFNELALELFALQREHNPAYRKFCEFRGVGKVDSWREIPCAPTAAFKEVDLTSLEPGERERVFYSSGTTQLERSRHFHSNASLALYEESLWLWFERNFLSRMPGMKWVFLTPVGNAAPNSSLAHMFETIAARLEEIDVRFLGEVDGDGSWSLDLGRCVEALSECERSGRTVAALGTAFQFVHLLDELQARGASIFLPEGSWVLETGGYKGRSREVPKEELRATLRLKLGAREIFGEYGMSELSSQAYDLGDGIFRFPPWARAQIVSPATGREVAEGERGLIRVYDLANVWSVMAVQTEDLAIKTNGGFTLAGRAARAEARGCSLMTV